MAYDHVRDLQRVVYTTALGPTSAFLSFPDLQYAYLASLGYTQRTLLERLAVWAMDNGIPITIASISLGLIGPALWTPADLTNPPILAIDADRADTYSKNTETNVLAGVHCAYGTPYQANPPNLITHTTNAALNGRNSFNAPGQSAQSLNFSTQLGSLLNGKSGCTMMFFGKFANANPGAFNSAVVNATTTSSSSTRCSISTSGAVSNGLRSTVRRLDADTANGDDYGANRGLLPFCYILRLDHTGAVVGAGTPTKEARIMYNGALETYSEATGLGTGNFSATNSAYIGFFNSGTVAQALVEMNFGFITDTVYSTEDCERLEGWALWRAELDSVLSADHPYKLAAPLRV